MSEYQKYLEQIGVLSEKLFNQIQELFPSVNVDDLDVYDCYTELEVTKAFANSVLNDFEYAYIEDVDIENKTIFIWDVQSMEDLNKIVEKFSKWKIGNYEELKKEVEQLEKEKKEETDLSKKFSLLNAIANKLSLEEVTKIYNEYANKNESPQSCS